MHYLTHPGAPDLPLPHGLAPSETMVADHSFISPLSAVNPMHKGFLSLVRPFLDLVSQQGVGVDPSLLKQLFFLNGVFQSGVFRGW